VNECNNLSYLAFPVAAFIAVHEIRGRRCVGLGVGIGIRGWRWVGLEVGLGIRGWKCVGLGVRLGIWW